MNKLNLKQQVFALVGVLLFITICGGLIMIWFTFKIDDLTQEIFSRPIIVSEIVNKMQYNLLMQKGNVTYFSIDKDTTWLLDLEKKREEFLTALKELGNHVSPDLDQLLVDISLKYSAYVSGMDRVISYYKMGKDNLALSLHPRLRQEYLDIVNQANKLAEEVYNNSKLLISNSQKQSRWLRFVSGFAIALVLLVGSILLLVIYKRILYPLTEIFEKVAKVDREKIALADISKLKDKVDDLIKSIDFTQVELEKSRETLAQAERMALVGRLAAGAAHSIRNPLTSVKMRLYSLSRSLNMTPIQKEDFDVISQEIRHIDSILQNFLDFSRPPKLQPRPMSLSKVVDDLLELMQHRINSYDVSVRLLREGELPAVMIDPEQMKEAMANIIINACEAMEEGGNLTISEGVTDLPGLGRCVFVTFEDSGPGIPEDIKPKIFQPFFTTKEQGTGLGLSIASRIVQEHGGKIEVWSLEQQGSKFTIYIPTIE